jgi:hypothetical protein
MCRPSCCNNSSPGSGGTGLTVIAIILATAIVAAKIGPAIAETGRIVLDVIRIAAIATGSVVVLAATIWLTVRVARRFIHLRLSQRSVPGLQATYRADFVPVSQQSCLACGDKGHVIRVIGTSVFVVRPCPECQPAQLAR